MYLQLGAVCPSECEFRCGTSECKPGEEKITSHYRWVCGEDRWCADNCASLCPDLPKPRYKWIAYCQLAPGPLGVWECITEPSPEAQRAVGETPTGRLSIPPFTFQHVLVFVIVVLGVLAVFSVV